MTQGQYGEDNDQDEYAAAVSNIKDEDWKKRSSNGSSRSNTDGPRPRRSDVCSIM